MRPQLQQNSGQQCRPSLRRCPNKVGKVLEFGRKNALAPPGGVSASSNSSTASASTLSEPNASAKSGALDRARSDTTGQPMTTNHGVAIGDNQKSLGGGCPFQTGAAGFVSFPQPVDEGRGDKLRGKPEKFADHYTQATLFYESQTAVEKAHIAGGFRFELSKLTVPAIRERRVSSLVKVSPELAATVSAGLGIAVPPAMPKVLAHPARPEVSTSPALSLTGLPGDGGIRSRRVAILVADGVDGKSVAAVQAALLAAGARVHLIAPRLGSVKTISGEPFDATGTLENSASVLFDGFVRPDGAGSEKALGSLAEVVDFVSNQIRHGKTVLALGASKALIDRAVVSATLGDGDADPGIVMAAAAKADRATAEFITALGRHRHPDREAGALQS